MFAFLSGFLVSVFLTCAFCFTPLSEGDFSKQVGLDFESQTTARHCLYAACDFVDLFAGSSAGASSTQQAIRGLLDWYDDRFPDVEEPAKPAPKLPDVR